MSSYTHHIFFFGGGQWRQTSDWGRDHPYPSSLETAAVQHVNIAARVFRGTLNLRAD